MQDPFADIPMASGPINTGRPTSQQTSEVDRARIGNDAARTGIAAENLRLKREEVKAKLAKDEQEAQEAAQLRQRNEDAAKGKLLAFLARASEVAQDANDNGGWFETGTTGALMRNLPGSNAAKDLVADTKTLRANLAFDALQAMRDASKTGGALGQVSEIELQLLESAVANVNPEGQTHENFLKNLGYARQAYLEKLALVAPEVARELGYDRAKAEESWKTIIKRDGKKFGVESVEQLRSGGAPSSGIPDDVLKLMDKYGAN